MQSGKGGNGVRPKLTAAGLVCACLGLLSVDGAFAYTINRSVSYGQGGSQQNEISDPEAKRQPMQQTLEEDVQVFMQDLQQGGSGQQQPDGMVEVNPEDAAALSDFLEDFAAQAEAQSKAHEQQARQKQQAQSRPLPKPEPRAQAAASQKQDRGSQGSQSQMRRGDESAPKRYTAQQMGDVSSAADAAGWFVPAPSRGHNYKSRDANLISQGNGFQSTAVAGPKTLDGSGNSQKTVNNERLSGKELMEQRLAAYDIEKWKADQAERDRNPFGDLRIMERVYKKIPTTSDAFFARSDLKADLVKGLIDEIQARFDAKQENAHGQVGFAVLDDKGILMLYNNTEYPLAGISAFHLAFATANTMSRLGDTPETHLRFDLNSLDFVNGSPFSTLKHSEPSTPFEYLPQDNTKSTKDNADAARQAKDAQQKRREAIAKAARRAAAGEGLVTKSERDALRAASSTVTGGKSLADLFYEKPEYSNLTEGAKNVFEGQLNLKRTSAVSGEIETTDLSKVRLTESAISSLIFYLLSYSDHNAFDVLLSYLGSTASLGYEIKAKGMEHTIYDVNYSDTIKVPELSNRNRSPLFDMAKSMASYIKDQDITITARGVIDNVLLFNPGDRNGLQRGIKSAVQKDRYEDRETLKILSMNGKAGFTAENRALVYTDLAYVEYLGERFIIVFGVKDSRGQTVEEALFKAEEITSFAGSKIFELLRSERPFLQGHAI